MDITDARRHTIWPIFTCAYDEPQASLSWTRWRPIFLSCAKLFGYARGQDWRLAHYLFKRRR